MYGVCALLPHNLLVRVITLVLVSRHSISEFRVSETARSWARIRDKNNFSPHEHTSGKEGFCRISLVFPYLRRARNEVKRKESERNVSMLEFVRQSHLFQIISRILQDTRCIKLAFNFREFQLAIVFGS